MLILGKKRRLALASQALAASLLTAIGMATLAIAAFALYPQFGAKGMALALAASEWGMVLAGVAFIRFKHQVSY